jgi:Tol biopolymer transport system component
MGNNGGFQSAVSADGRFVAFTSSSTDLVPQSDTNNTSDVFVRDLQNGTTTLVSINQAGAATGNSFSDKPSISADGRYVAFESLASDLVSGVTDDNSFSDVFVRDMLTGTTTLVNVSLSGKNTPMGDSSKPIISADGRFVVFLSDAPGLTATLVTSSRRNVYLRDMKNGVTSLVSVNRTGTANGDGASGQFAMPVLSSDGRFIAFESQADDLVANDTNGRFGTDVFVRDMQAGTTTLVTVNSAGTGSANKPYTGTRLAMSDDGRFVAFESEATDLAAGVTDKNQGLDIFVRDLTAQTTSMLSVNSSAAAGNRDSMYPAMSRDGRYVVFISFATDLLPNDKNGGAPAGSPNGDVFVRDTWSGITRLVSINLAGTDSGNGNSGFQDVYPAISPDGRYVLFISSAANLTSANDTNGVADLFLRDMQEGATKLVSHDRSGNAAGTIDFIKFYDMSADGRVIGFTSQSPDVAANDSNGFEDVFAYDVLADKPGPIDSSDAFVSQHYHDFLSRMPDPSGLQFWTNNIESCGADQNCRAVKRVDTSAAFFLSIEFQQTGFLVYRFYKAAFGNLPGKPVPVIRSAFLPDTQAIGSGVVVGQTGWDTQLENNKRAFALAFVQRAAFQNAYPSTMTADQFVSQLDTNAGGVLTDADKATLVSTLGSTPSDPAKRAQVLRSVAENPAFSAQEKNRAFVLMQYFGYLKRNPNDLPDSDYSGYSFWLSKLDQFGGDYVKAEMVKAFISSTEYGQRFSN